MPEYGFETEQIRRNMQKRNTNNSEISIIRIEKRPDLKNFDRRQDVRRVWQKQGSRYALAEQPFLMDWDAKRKNAVADGLCADGCIAYAAMEGERIAGFVSVLKELNGGRMILDIIQVDRAFRGHGIGRRLWETAAAEARKAGAHALYLSAFCAEETIAFYRAMGAQPASDPIAEIAQAEPCDVQMEYILRP